MVKAILPLLFFIITPSLQAQSSGSIYGTDGMPNGRFWLTVLDDKTRTAFIIGFMEGIRAYETRVGDNEQGQILRNTALLPEEVVSEIDAFYADKANNPIPLSLAYIYVLNKSKGWSPDNLAKLLAEMRKASTR